MFENTKFTKEQIFEIEIIQKSKYLTVILAKRIKQNRLKFGNEIYS